MAIKEILKEDVLEQVTGGAYCYHRVEKGETLDAIAKMTGIQQSTLMCLNGIKNADLIYAGQTIKYPC